MGMLMPQPIGHSFALQRRHYLTFFAFTAIGAALWAALYALRPDPPASVPDYLPVALLGGLYVLAFLAGLAITEKRNAVVAFAGYAFGVFAAQAYGLTGYSDSLIGVCFSAAFGIPIRPAFLAGDGLVRLLRMRRGS